MAKGFCQGRLWRLFFPKPDLQKKNEQLFSQLTNIDTRQRLNSWLKLNIVISGLLTASTYMAILSPYVDYSTNEVQTGKPLVSNGTIFYLVRGFSAVSFMFSLLCIATAFTFWKTFNYHSTTFYLYHLHPPPRLEELARLEKQHQEQNNPLAAFCATTTVRPWSDSKTQQLFDNFDYGTSFIESFLILSIICAMLPVLLIVLVVIGKVAAIALLFWLTILGILVVFVFLYFSRLVAIPDANDPAPVPGAISELILRRGRNSDPYLNVAFH